MQIGFRPAAMNNFSFKSNESKDKPSHLNVVNSEKNAAEEMAEKRRKAKSGLDAYMIGYPGMEVTEEEIDAAVEAKDRSDKNKSDEAAGKRRGKFEVIG